MVVWCAGNRRATVRLVFPHFAPMTSCIAGSNCLSCIDTAQQFAHHAPPSSFPGWPRTLPAARVRFSWKIHAQTRQHACAWRVDA